MIPGLLKAVELALAVAVYMVAIWIVTEWLKPLLTRLLKAEVKDGKALGLAWGVGLLLFLLLALLGCYAVSWESGIAFVVITGLCTRAYKWDRLKRAVRWITGGGGDRA